MITIINLPTLRKFSITYPDYEGTVNELVRLDNKELAELFHDLRGMGFKVKIKL